MSIDCITAYRTEDGILFVDRKEAEAHNKNLDFIRWLDEKNFYHFDADVTSEDVCIWLKENKTKILEYLK
jgi:dsDNA-binding SOS-regulon protein